MEIKRKLDESSIGRKKKQIWESDSSRNIVAIYTILAILTRMRKTLGLEAMLEYIEEYQKAIIMHNPTLKGTVNRAMLLMNIERLYAIMVGRNEK